MLLFYCYLFRREVVFTVRVVIVSLKRLVYLPFLDVRE